MGHKVHPTGFRIGVIYDWQSKWYAGKNYRQQLHEDIAIRQRIMKTAPDAGISRIDIDRNANAMTVTIHTAKPGIVIGRGGANVDELRNELERTTGRRVRVNINEIRQPELDAYLVARSIADQLQRRVAFRRAIKQTVARTMARGAKGIKVTVAGRLGGSEMSRRESEKQGRIPLHTLRADIDFGLAEAHTTFGRIGVKVWIYKGDIQPEPKRRPVVEAAPEAAPPAAPVATDAVPAATVVPDAVTAAAPAVPDAVPATAPVVPDGVPAAAPAAPDAPAPASAGATE
ncbi:MAG: 30S ribosomal protein S3 [Dehalococcoidia bacterium]